MTSFVASQHEQSWSRRIDKEKKKKWKADDAKAMPWSRLLQLIHLRSNWKERAKKKKDWCRALTPTF